MSSPAADSAPAPAAAAARGRFRLTTFSSLKHRDYLYVFLGVVFTSAGQWMENVALGWLVYEMTNSPFLLGVLGGLRAVPFLFFGLFGGAMADRVDRKALMLWSQLFILALYVWLVAVLFLGITQVWHIFAFVLLGSVAWVFNQPARQSMIPLLVPREDFMNAVALQSVGFNVTRVLGPVLGGVLMAWLGPTVTFVLITVTWLGVIWWTLLIRVPPVAAAPGARPRTSVLHDILEGLRYVRGNAVVRGLIILALVPQVVAMPYLNLMPVFARDVFGLDARGLGEMMMATGVGALVSTLAVASLGMYQGKGRLLLASGVALGTSVLGFGLSANYLLSLVLLVGAGGFTMAFMALSNTLLQLATDHEYLGRVMSIYMLDRGLFPLGAFLAGLVAEVTSAPVALSLMGGLSLALMAVAAARMPEIRRVG